MNRERVQSIAVPGQRPNRALQTFRTLCTDLWIVPVFGVVITIVILVIEHARLSEVGVRFANAFIYALLIGFPTAVTLNWIGFRYTQRFPRFVFVLHGFALLFTATIGSLVGAFVVKSAGLIHRDSWWTEVHSSFPISIVITFVAGLSITSFETLRHRLERATLELRTRQVEQERANKLLAEARLSSLESSIHPHFLFNTLNSIASLIPSDPKRAEDTVGKLASLLRFSISANQNSLVPLAQELKIVHDYLEIESTRFGPRLRCQVSVPDNLADLKVPPLALQTLVENSVKHVVAQRSEPTFIAITGARHETFLELTVTDDGPGFSLAKVAPDHGLGNLIARLELLFGESAQLNVSRIQSKTVVTIKVPAEETT